MDSTVEKVALDVIAYTAELSRHLDELYGHLELPKFDQRVLWVAGRTYGATDARQILADVERAFLAPKRDAAAAQLAVVS